MSCPKSPYFDTHLFDTLSLVNVSDDLLGNWVHDRVEF